MSACKNSNHDGHRFTNYSSVMRVIHVDIWRHFSGFDLNLKKVLLFYSPIVSVQMYSTLSRKTSTTFVINRLNNLQDFTSFFAIAKRIFEEK